MLNQQYLYHGTCSGSTIIRTKSLSCCSGGEYSFEVEGNILSLTRCFTFAKEYASHVRDDIPSPMIFVLDRKILNQTHKITVARSEIYEEYSRHECEEFVDKHIPINHPALVNIIKL